MSRDIKFRAWRKEVGDMEQVCQITWFGSRPGTVAYPDTYSIDTIQDKEDVALMPYTGLKDKNGVEIYEGDIVRGIATWGATDVYYEEHYGAFSGRDTDDVHALNRHDASKLYEVIGNIYENPELLKEQS